MVIAGIWFVVGVVLFVVELVSPLFVMFFFGLGAWAAGVAALFTDELGVQVLVFGVACILFLLALRRTLVRTFRGRAKLSSDAACEGMPRLYAGKSATVTRPIVRGAVGEISVGGSYWRAVSSVDLPQGAQVRVIGHVPDDELTLEVAPCGEGSCGPQEETTLSGGNDRV